MWKLATSELLSTFFPTWLWQGRQWRKGKVPRHDDYYWGNAHALPVLASYYPPNILASYVSSFQTIRCAWISLLLLMSSHLGISLVGFYTALSSFSNPPVALFGAITLTFGAVSLRQQPCILYTLAWFPWTLSPNPCLSAFALGMMILAGYYPFGIYLVPISIISHVFWFKEAWLLFGFLIGLPQLIPFVRHLPDTIKRMDDKCESPEVERRFYVGVIPIVLLPLSTSRIWPLTLISCLFALGVGKSLFPRVHERWLIVVQFCIGWMATSGLANLGLPNEVLWVILLLHIADLWWHNRHLLPPRPYCELWKRPDRAFDTDLTRYLEANLGDYRLSGLPWPLFTGHINSIRTIGYCGSMQTKSMWAWRKSFRHDPFIDGVDEDDLTKHGVKYAYSRKKPPGWGTTPIRGLYRNPRI